MTDQQLDKKLRELTPYEQLLFNKEVSADDYSGIKHVTVNGQTLLLIPVGGSEAFPKLIHPLVSLHKNMRFKDTPAHIHRGVELTYMYSGVNVMTMDERQYTLTKGQFLLMDSKIPHAINTVGTMEDVQISVLFDPDFINEIGYHYSSNNVLSNFLSSALSVDSPHTSFIIFHAEEDERCGIYMRELIKEYLEPTANGRDVVTHLLSLLFLEFKNMLVQDTHYEISSPRTSSKIDILHVVSYLNANYNHCTLQSTADYFGLCPTYLSALLKRYTGLSFHNLILKYRFNHAIELLEQTDQPIENIAKQVGYNTTTYFYKKFREVYHCSPKEYRAAKSRPEVGE